MRTHLAVLLALALVAVALLATGCARAAERAVERASGVKVEEQGGKVTIKTKEGEASLSAREGKVPEGFPLPLAPGTQIVQGLKTESKGKQHFQVVLGFSGQVKSIAEFYEKALRDAGYEVDRMEQQSGDEAVVILSGKGATYTAHITISRKTDDEKGSAMIVLTSKE